MADQILKSPEVLQAFAHYDRVETIQNFKVACILGMLLMPAGYVLDKNVYPEVSMYFLQLRLFSSVLIAAFLGVLLTKLGQHYYRLLGVTLFMIPASFIAWMIYKSEGVISPYYAGLNLVLLVLAFVLHWTFWESLAATGLVIAVYLTACFFCMKYNPAEHIDLLVNNLYFLGLTGIIVVTGSYFHSKSRLREFALRFELDRNRQSLEENNVTLDRQNKELEDTIQKLTEAESQLVQSEKMASLGRMSAGIIHEINNPLNFATTGIFTLKKKGQTRCGRTTGGIQRDPQRRGRRDFAGEEHRVRSAHVHPSEHRQSRSGQCLRGGGVRVAFPEQRDEGQGDDRTKVR